MEKKYLSRDRIVGKQVIDSNANVVGSVKDIAIDLDSKSVALSVSTKTGVDVTVGGDNITVVGDVVLLNKPVAVPAPSTLEQVSAPVRPQVPLQPPAAPTTAPPVTLGLCSVCGYQNDANSKFCIKCGSKLK